MIKLIVLSTFLAFGAAFPTIFHDDTAIHTISAAPLITGVKTVLAPETIQIHEPTITKVGDIVHKIPTSVSHQSQTVVHEHTDVHTPIVAPGVRTYTSHILKAYSTPVVYASAAPVLKVLH